MEEREILLVDRDTTMRSDVAAYFRDEGYEVETTDSAVHAFCTVLEKQVPVVLLSGDCDARISTADLIHLLKKCNRKLAVILISDDVPVQAARKIRQEGIFYHALKPVTREDAEEILQAVDSAFGTSSQQENGGASGSDPVRH